MIYQFKVTSCKRLPKMIQTIFRKYNVQHFFYNTTRPTTIFIGGYALIHSAALRSVELFNQSAPPGLTACVLAYTPGIAVTSAKPPVVVDTSNLTIQDLVSQNIIEEVFGIQLTRVPTQSSDSLSCRKEVLDWLVKKAGYTNYLEAIRVFNNKKDIEAKIENLTKEIENLTKEIDELRKQL